MSFNTRTTKECVSPCWVYENTAAVTVPVLPAIEPGMFKGGKAGCRLAGRRGRSQGKRRREKKRT